MAYNNYYQTPQAYSQNGYVPYQQVPQQNPQLQIQNGGFVPVPSEDFARNYPIAPGTSMSFRDENLPYLYTKTMGYSPLDQPIFEKFRRVEEGTEEPAEAKKYALKTDVDALRDEITTLRTELNKRKNFDKKRGERDE